MSDKFIKWLLIFTACYFALHAIRAMAQTTIVTMPDGSMVVCISQGGYVTCY